MATKKRSSGKKRKHTTRPRSVGGTKIAVGTKRRKRRSVGSIKTTLMSDAIQIAAGVAIGSMVDTRFVTPVLMRNATTAKFGALVKIVGGVYAAKQVKNPILKGACYALIANGVADGVKLIAPNLGMSKVGDTSAWMELPYVGEIPQNFVGEIPEDFVGYVPPANNMMSGEEIYNQPYLPIGA